MNRYKIKNLRTGNNFEVIRATQPLLNQPEWGSQAGTKLKADCDEWELANGQSAGNDDNGNELWSYPDSRQLTAENIDAEIAAEEAKKTKMANVENRLIQLASADPATLTAAQQRQALVDLGKAIIFLRKNQID